MAQSVSAGPIVKAAPVMAVTTTTIAQTTTPAPATNNGGLPLVKAPVTTSQGVSTFQGLMPPATANAIPVVPTPVPKATTSAPSVPAPKPAPAIQYGSAKPLGEDTHPVLNMTADKAELVRLDTDAASVIVGNPENLSVQLENRRLLVLTPQKSGATYLSILDDAGNLIMQRHVIVSTPKANYIRIRRSCSGQDKNCQETSVYYCPGMCHAVGGSAAMPSGAAAPVSSGNTPAAGGTTASGGSTGTSPAPSSAPMPTVTTAPASAATTGY